MLALFSIVASSPVALSGARSRGGTAGVGGGVGAAHRRGVAVFSRVSSSVAVRAPGRVTTSASAGGGREEEARRPKGARAKRQRQLRERPPAPLRCAEPSAAATVTEAEEAAAAAGSGAVEEGVSVEKAAPAEEIVKSSSESESDGAGPSAREIGTVGVFVGLLAASVAAAGGPEVGRCKLKSVDP
jgi:hypothetical protein